MLSDLLYEKDRDRFEDYKFSGEAWSAPDLEEPAKIRELLDSFHLVGRRIKKLRLIGLNYSLVRDQIEDSVYERLVGLPEEMRQSQSDYKNIADEATISGHEDAEYLNDGLLSVYKYLNEDFGKYIQETVIEKTTTFTLDFEEARTVRAVMVYTSKDEFIAFSKIARIEFVCIEDGKEVVRYIKDVELSAECYQANDYDGSIFYISPGAAAYAEFDELNVKSIRITIEVPENQDSVGISEIRVLGK